MECGGCTACCKNLELHEVPSAIGELCRHCTENVGCQIYEERPQECKEFLCMWAQMQDAGEELRPDKCGVIFSRSGDDVIAGRVDSGRKLNPLVMAQINNFKEEGFSVMLFRNKEKKCFLNPPHDIDYVLGVISGSS